MAWRTTRHAIVVGLLALSVLAARPTPTLACSCASGDPPVDVVFVGRAIAVLEGKWVRERLSARDFYVGSTVALLTVQLMWEGQEQPFFAVVGGSEASCTLHFVPGSTYLVYGQFRETGPLDTNICLGSRQMDIASN